MSEHTNKLFNALWSEVKKNSDSRVLKLFKFDPVDKTQEKMDPETQPDKTAIKKLLKHEKNVNDIRCFVSLTAMLIEMDKHYTQALADSLLFLSDKSSGVRQSLYDKISHKLNLNTNKPSEASVEKILSKDRKTIDERDTLMTDLYKIFTD